MHAKQGYLVLLLAVSLTTVDLLNVFRRVYSSIRSGEKFQLRSFWTRVIIGREDADLGGIELEYAHLVTEEPEEMVATPPSPHKQVHYDSPIDERDGTAQWANDVRQHRRQFSHSATSEATLYHSRSSSRSDDTLHVIKRSRYHNSKPALIRRIGSTVFTILERVMVFWAYAQVLSGVSVYTGALYSIPAATSPSTNLRVI